MDMEVTPGFSEEEEEEEEEKKIEIKVVSSCLICASPAVISDSDGNIVKREPLIWSEEQLLMYLCEGLGLKDKWERKSYSKLQLEPFPFCSLCEMLITSLAEVYSKLEELKIVVRGKLEEAEQIYSSQKLYKNHEPAYFKFRNDVFRVGGTRRKVGTERKYIKNNNEYEMSPCSSSAVEQEEEEEEDAKESTTILTAKRKNTVPANELKNNLKSNERVGSSVKKKAKRKYLKEKSGAESKLKKEEIIKKERKPGFARVKAISKTIVRRCSDTVPIKVEKGMEKINLKRSTFRASNIGFMERDPSTGNISYSTGFGNRFKSTRTNLIFKQIELKDGDGKLGYECTSCSQHFPLLLGSMKQQRLFRHHFLTSHSDRYKCRLCPSDTDTDNNHRYKNREQLFQHLTAIHSISTMADYHIAIGKRVAVIGVPLPKNCPVCEMPLEHCGNSKSEYKFHLQSHMSEEERRDSLLEEHSRRYKELPTATLEQLSSGKVNQCQTCGHFITNGGQGLRRHEMDSHQDHPPPSLTYLCPICGVSFSSNYILEQHTIKKHPDGKSEGPFKCKFPTCNAEGMWDEPSLKGHIEENHGESEESSNNVLCMICGRVLSSSWSLKQHGLIHSGEKPHKCQFCNKSFPLKSTLKLHLFTKHLVGAGTWKCEQEGCNRVFANQKYFRIHMRSEHGQYVKMSKKRKKEAVAEQSTMTTT
ncbi:unnamed protein product [Orchesella dallaii]|uniref:C2H2-type domain-containing protein n=1 Tax=Orchesella dallaii TaxID=48710 RepID=A0ABP1S9S2_9HEXA